MKVFVTGASGFVGREVLRQLRAAGHSIRFLARNPQSAQIKKIAAQFDAQIHPGSVLDAAMLPAGLQDMDAVIHLVGIIGEAGKNTFENVHVNGTRNVVSAAQKAGVRRHIQMSALGTRPNAISQYHRTKWAAEEIVRGSGLDYTIFRPSIIYGPHDHFVNLFDRMARFSPVLPIMGTGQGTLQPVPVGDVAKCFAGSLVEPKSIGQTYDSCGLEIFTFEEILDTILRVTGRKRLKVHVPMPLARAQAAILEFIFSKLLRKAPPLSRDQLLMLQEDNTGNPAPANELFSIVPEKFAEGISKYLDGRLKTPQRL